MTTMQRAARVARAPRTPRTTRTPRASRTARTRRLASCVLAGLVLPLLAPWWASSSGSAGAAPAAPGAVDEDAHRVVHRDDRRDVLHYDVRTEARRPAPEDRATDIVRTLVGHARHRVVVRAYARRLQRTGYRMLLAEVLTSAGRRFDLAVDYSARPIQGRISLTRQRSGAAVTCSGASWTATRTADRVAAVIPRSCLGDPRWVRVGVGLVAAPRDLKTSRADDSRLGGRVGGQHLRLGPRQPRA